MLVCRACCPTCVSKPGCFWPTALNPLLLLLRRPQTIHARIMGMQFEEGRDGTKHFVLQLDSRSESLQDFAKWEDK